MFDKITKKDDTELLEYFENFENIPPTDKSTVDWFVLTDFQVFSEYLINDIQEIQERLKSADEQYLYYVCEHMFNILDWIKLMVYDAGYPTFDDAFESLFEKKFGDSHIIQNIYNTCFEKWIAQKSGQQQIGENFYNVLAGRLYYRNHLGKWFEVDRKTAFDLRPDQVIVNDEDVINKLNKEYKETRYDLIFKQWRDKQYQGTLSDDFLQFDDKETTPEAYFDFAIEHIKNLLKNPISVTELERWNGGEIVDLDYMIKMSALILETVVKRRKDNSHTLYLLRDSLMFYELHKTLDILNSEDTSVDQVMIGRKLLSNGANEWGYYIATLEALYTAHLRYPENFEEFYKEYTRLLDIFASMNQGFVQILASLADYIKKHIRTDKNKIVVFDIGFQGSIALLSKYIIDHHLRPSNTSGEIKTDIKVAVGSLWSKKLFKKRYEGFYFPYLNRVQLLTRNNDLYSYKTDSLNSGKLQVLMGDKETQRKAAIELVVVVMVALLAHTESDPL